ncbi:hypothetical protein [Rhodococcoides yunnanense]|uniref:hypothetical protein n=1 Tax=Rhodococcoides yunnanense TaxID=278209 RepID=UPI001114F30B|nr:hypothetical protein [Rhodococcus yunnanensis]
MPASDSQHTSSVWSDRRRAPSQIRLFVFGPWALSMWVAALDPPYGSETPVLLLAALLGTSIVFHLIAFRRRYPTGEAGIVRNAGVTTVHARRYYFGTYVVSVGLAGLTSGAALAQLHPSDAADLAASVPLVAALVWCAGYLIQVARGVIGAPKIEISGRGGIDVHGMSYDERLDASADARSIALPGRAGPRIMVHHPGEDVVERRYRTRIFALDHLSTSRRVEPACIILIDTTRFDCDPRILLTLVQNAGLQ